MKLTLQFHDDLYSPPRYKGSRTIHDIDITMDEIDALTPGNGLAVLRALYKAKAMQEQVLGPGDSVTLAQAVKTLMELGYTYDEKECYWKAPQWTYSEERMEHDIDPKLPVHIARCIQEDDTSMDAVIFDRNNPDRHPHADLIHAWAEGAEIEYQRGFSIWTKCDIPGTPSWDTIVKYRIAEPELTKPEINWDHVHPDFNWLAIDEDGCFALFQDKPFAKGNYWTVDDGLVFSSFANEPNPYASFKPGTCDWKDSLVCRPGVDGHE